MRYVIVDQEGASRGHFDLFADVLRAIDESREDVDMIRDFCVLGYDDQGHRVGQPIEAITLLPRSAHDLAQSVSSLSGVAEAWGAADWHVQKQSSDDLLLLSR